MHAMPSQKGGQNISWKWTQSLYLKETTTTTPGVRMCLELTRDHIWLNSFTRMRVYLAAQVSYWFVVIITMGASTKPLQWIIIYRLWVKVWLVLWSSRTMTTQGKQDYSFGCWIVFFYYLNVRSPLAHQLQRKESIAPFRKPTDCRFKV